MDASLNISYETHNLTPKTLARPTPKNTKSPEIPKNTVDPPLAWTEVLKENGLYENSKIVQIMTKDYLTQVILSFFDDYCRHKNLTDCPAVYFFKYLVHQKLLDPESLKKTANSVALSLACYAQNNYEMKFFYEAFNQKTCMTRVIENYLYCRKIIKAFFSAKSSLEDVKMPLNVWTALIKKIFKNDPIEEITARLREKIVSSNRRKALVLSNEKKKTGSASKDLENAIRTQTQNLEVDAFYFILICVDEFQTSQKDTKGRPLSRVVVSPPRQRPEEEEFNRTDSMRINAGEGYTGYTGYWPEALEDKGFYQAKRGSLFAANTQRNQESSHNNSMMLYNDKYSSERKLSQRDITQQRDASLGASRDKLNASVMTNRPLLNSSFTTNVKDIENEEEYEALLQERVAMKKKLAFQTVEKRTSLEVLLWTIKLYENMTENYDEVFGFFKNMQGDFNTMVAKIKSKEPEMFKNLNSKFVKDFVQSGPKPLDSRHTNHVIGIKNKFEKKTADITKLKLADTLSQPCEFLKDNFQPKVFLSSLSINFPLISRASRKDTSPNRISIHQESPLQTQKEPEKTAPNKKLSSENMPESETIRKASQNSYAIPKATEKQKISQEEAANKKKPGVDIEAKKVSQTKLNASEVPLSRKETTSLSEIMKQTEQAEDKTKKESKEPSASKEIKSQTSIADKKKPSLNTIANEGVQRKESKEVVPPQLLIQKPAEENKLNINNEIKSNKKVQEENIKVSSPKPELNPKEKSAESRNPPALKSDLKFAVMPEGATLIRAYLVPPPQLNLPLGIQILMGSLFDQILVSNPSLAALHNEIIQSKPLRDEHYILPQTEEQKLQTKESIKPSIQKTQPDNRPVQEEQKQQTSIFRVIAPSNDATIIKGTLPQPIPITLSSGMEILTGKKIETQKNIANEYVYPNADTMTESKTQTSMQKTGSVNRNSQPQEEKTTIFTVVSSDSTTIVQGKLPNPVPITIPSGMAILTGMKIDTQRNIINQNMYPSKENINVSSNAVQRPTTSNINSKPDQNQQSSLFAVISSSASAIVSGKLPPAVPITIPSGMEILTGKKIETQKNIINEQIYPQSVQSEANSKQETQNHAQKPPSGQSVQNQQGSLFAVVSASNTAIVKGSLPPSIPITIPSGMEILTGKKIETQKNIVNDYVYPPTEQIQESKIQASSSIQKVSSTSLNKQSEEQKTTLFAVVSSNNTTIVPGKLPNPVPITIPSGIEILTGMKIETQKNIINEQVYPPKEAIIQTSEIKEKQIPTQAGGKSVQHQSSLFAVVASNNNAIVKGVLPSPAAITIPSGMEILTGMKIDTQKNIMNELVYPPNQQAQEIHNQPPSHIQKPRSATSSSQPEEQKSTLFTVVSSNHATIVPGKLQSPIPITIPSGMEILTGMKIETQKNFVNEQVYPQTTQIEKNFTQSLNTNQKLRSDSRSSEQKQQTSLFTVVSSNQATIVPGKLPSPIPITITSGMEILTGMKVETQRNVVNEQTYP